MDKDVCAQAPSGFDAIFAAPGHSQLAGVLAAVLFTCIILLLSDRTSPPPITWARQNALLVMVSTFFGLLVVSFCFAVTMGETDCKRAQAATIGIAGLFAVSAVGAMYALSWLFDAYETGFKELSTVSGTIVFIVAAYVFAEMGITFIDFQDKYPRDLILKNTVLWIYIGVTVAAVFVLWLRWLHTESPENASAKRSAIAIIAYAACAVIIFSCLITPTVEDWRHDAAPWYAIAASIGSLVGVAVPIYFMLMTTPHRVKPTTRFDQIKVERRIIVVKLVKTYTEVERSPARTSPPEHP
jgi:hypothetical protein